MAIIRLVPSAYSLSSTQYLTISDASNMYTNVDSTTYAQINHNRANTTAYYLYISGFNFSSVPSDAEVTSFTVKIRALESGLSTNSSYRMSLYNNTTAISNTTATASLSTTATTFTFPNGNLTWTTMTGYGNDFRIRVPLRRNSSNTAGYVRVYGAEIEVVYTVPELRTITTSLTGSGTISPSGTTTLYDDDEFKLTITPTNKYDDVTITNNNVDVTEDLAPHYIHSPTDDQTTSKTAVSFTTQLSAAGANFYTGANTTGNYFNYAVGHTAESPGSTSTSYNTYVKDNGSNTATGWAIYSFDFSDIPENAEIDSIEVKCYGATENTTHDATHKANITLYSGDHLKSTEQYFTSTSNSVITINDPGEWSRDELDDANLRFEVAYYGGRLFGITWSVNYFVAGRPDYYTYTYVVSGNAVIAVTIIGRTSALFVKPGATWVEAKRAWTKNAQGVWVENTNLTTVFDSNGRYFYGGSVN